MPAYMNHMIMAHDVYNKIDNMGIEFCASCNDIALYDGYCYSHRPYSSYSSTNSFCKVSYCLNRVPYSWRDYCNEHSYLEY